MGTEVPKVGDPVEVHAFGNWYAGKVVKATAVRLSIEYTSGTGWTRIKVVPVAPKKAEVGHFNTGRLWRLPGEGGASSREIGEARRRERYLGGAR